MSTAVPNQRTISPVGIAHRHRAADHPAILAVMAAQAMLDLVGLAGRAASAATRRWPSSSRRDGTPRRSGRRAAPVKSTMPLVEVFEVARRRRPTRRSPGSNRRACAGRRRARSCSRRAAVLCRRERSRRMTAWASTSSPSRWNCGQAVGPRRGVDHAQRAERQAFLETQRLAGVEADVRLAGDQRVVGEARVERGVAAPPSARRRASRARRTRCRAAFPWRSSPSAAEEPLALLLDQADQRDRRLAQPARRSGRSRRARDRPRANRARSRAARAARSSSPVNVGRRQRLRPAGSSEWQWFKRDPPSASIAE